MEMLSEPPFSLPNVFDAVDEAIDSNADIAEAILAVGLSTFAIKNDDWKGKATPNDLDKARSTIRQLYRDWSAEGSPERHASYSPIISALGNLLPSDPAQRQQYRILVPGAGLGRLSFDLCKQGYTVEGNEMSYHQLLASNYMLNHTQTAGQHRLHPWALSFSNHLTRARQLQAVCIPDIHPATILAEASASWHSDGRERMGMSAGDFCEIYQQQGYQDAFDAVTTCFFIDTAPNVIRYIETIRHCLRPDGLWVNLGPLLWHFESAPTPAEKRHQRQQKGINSPSTSPFSGPGIGIGEHGSFELTDDEVITLVKRLGFQVIEHKQSPAGGTGYIQDSASMLQNTYMPSFWVARKL